ncbi:metal ABC transporter ATP-binding protein [Entomobacter blattae]|uniref:Iron(3+)-hydroxamate import ATP-binding protein FhuC n=1 Tax=Entomobacter blattae TaxID=2762277 RepID=A0A7H1NPS4_9PROT|nr:metal ABC transporter ATP-binding protein [Entomobacter blattae]QNT77784.1 Iron(3+)-hydroxamate import ATP-binding protein FhuC [Entomobacter blattae]
MNSVYPSIEGCHLTLRHGSRTIVEDTSFKISDGAFVGLIGHNGAGKTTLIKALLNLHPLYRGEIKIKGVPLSKKLQTSMAYLPQNLPFIPLSGYSLLSLACQKLGGLFFFSRHQEKEKIDAVLSFVNGHHFAKRPVSSLSGGERQRIFLALALLSQPKVLILDEPFSSLDPAQAENILALLQKINIERQTTILCSTHQIFSLASVVTDILCLKAQKAIIGKTETILHSSLLAEIYGLPERVLKTM